MTAPVFIGNIEDTLQRLRWTPRLSPWRPFRFCVHLHNGPVYQLNGCCGIFAEYGATQWDSGNCPACRTTLIATRFWVVMICPIIKCLTVLRVFFYFVWFVFIHHNFQFYFELCTYCNILDIYLSQNLNFVNYLLFYMKLLNYLFFNMFGSVLECCELTGVSLL